MTLSEPFIRRPVATSLLAVAVALAGALAFANLRVAPLPQVAYPTIIVSAGLPGASPETMAASVATPLERQFGRIAGVTEMTSSSGLGSTTVVLQFDLARDIDAAARDVQAAINAARAQLPANLPSNPSYRKANPADAPAMILALSSDTLPIGRVYDLASSILAQEIAQIDGVGQVSVGGGALPAVRVELNPTVLNKYQISLEQVRGVLQQANANRPKGQLSDERTSWEIHTNDQLLHAVDYVPLIIAASQGAVVRLGDLGTVSDSVQDVRAAGLVNGHPAVADRGDHRAGRQCHRHRRSGPRRAAAIPRVAAAGRRPRHRDRPHHHHSRFRSRRRADAGHRHRPGRRGGVRVPAKRLGDDHPERRRATVAARHVRRDVGCSATA